MMPLIALRPLLIENQSRLKVRAKKTPERVLKLFLKKFKNPKKKMLFLRRGNILNLSLKCHLSPKRMKNLKLWPKDYYLISLKNIKI